MAKVSIQVPVYNGEKYLSKCLQSIADNAPPDSEILIMDDGSKDNSCAIIKEFVSADSRFVFDQSKTDGEIRNIMANATDCEYIMPFDHDDIFLPGREKHFKYLDEHPEVPAAYGITLKLQKSRLSLYMGHTFSNFNIFNGGNPAGHGSLIIRKTAFKEAGEYIIPFINQENNQKSGSGDWYLIQRLGELGKLLFTRDYSFIYRIHSQQISKAGTYQNKNTTRDVARKRFTEKYASEINGVLAGRKVAISPEIKPVYMQIYGMIFFALSARKKNPEVILELAERLEPDDYAVRFFRVYHLLSIDQVEQAVKLFYEIMNDISHDWLLSVVLARDFLHKSENKPYEGLVREAVEDVFSKFGEPEVEPRLAGLVKGYL